MALDSDNPFADLDAVAADFSQQDDGNDDSHDGDEKEEGGPSKPAPGRRKRDPSRVSGRDTRKRQRNSFIPPLPEEHFAFICRELTFGAAIAYAMIVRQIRVTGVPWVWFGNDILDRYGISLAAFDDALKALEAAGFIETDRHRGRRTRVSLNISRWDVEA